MIPDRYQIHHQIIATQVHDMIKLMDQHFASIYGLERTGKDHQEFKNNLDRLKISGQALSNKLQAWGRYQIFPLSRNCNRAESIQDLVIRFFSHEVKLYGLKFTYSQIPANLTIKADPLSLCNVLILLLQYRIFPNPKNTPAKSFHFEFKKENKNMFIRLTDDGPPVTEKELLEMNKTNQIETGIGFNKLFLAKHIVEEELAGEMEVYGKDYHSQITVRLEH